MCLTWGDEKSVRFACSSFKVPERNAVLGGSARRKSVGVRRDALWIVTNDSGNDFLGVGYLGAKDLDCKIPASVSGGPLIAIIGGSRQFDDPLSAAT